RRSHQHFVRLPVLGRRLERAQNAAGPARALISGERCRPITNGRHRSGSQLANSMKIADLRLTGLAGGTVEGGWAAELEPQDNIHTIVEVVAEDGRVGVGSA